MINLKRIADNTNSDSIASRMRRKRTQRFLQMIEAFPEPVRVLDVGGTVQFWQAFQLPKVCHITVLNIHLEDCGGQPGFTSVAGDARNMETFADGQFDLCFSNSVIEHVGTLHDQVNMGREIRRVARAYFVQTPNRYFPLEPHFLVPFWQFLPLPLRTAMLRRLNLGWMRKTPDALAARAEIEQIRLLNGTEMKAIFHDATIHREKIGPFTKSIIAAKTAAG